MCKECLPAFSGLPVFWPATGMRKFRLDLKRWVFEAHNHIDFRNWLYMYLHACCLCHLCYAVSSKEIR